MSKAGNYDRHEIEPVRDPQPDEARLRNYVEFVFDEDRMRLGRYNRDWFLSPDGSMYSTADYIIPSQRLHEEDWLLHLMASNGLTPTPSCLPTSRPAGALKLNV